MRYKTLLSILSLICSSTLVLAHPDSSQSTATLAARDAEPTFSIAKRRRTHQCADQPWMEKIEAQAWADAGAIAEQAIKWDNQADNNLQPLADYWMGNDSIDGANANVIKNIFTNEQKIHHSNWVFPEAVVDIYCGEHPIKNVKCRLQTNPNDPNGPKVTAYASSWVSRGYFWNTYNIVLCPRFFKEKYALEEIIKGMTDGTLDRYDAENYKKAWGFTIFHELVHLDPIIADRVVWDAAYGSCRCRKLAVQNRCAGPVNWRPKSAYVGDPTSLNAADNYAFFGASTWFKYVFGIGSPATAKDTCDIYNPSSTSVDTSDYSTLEGILDDADDRIDGTYNYTVPPDVPAGNTPADDQVITFPDPYTSRSLPSDLARPYSDAEAYFSTRSMTAESTYAPTTVPESLSSLKMSQTTSSAGPTASSSPGSANTSGAQQLAIASYTNPLGDPAAWSRLISYDTNKLSVLVANVLNGPDYVVNDAWADVIRRAAASGKTTIGYVRTGYLGVSVQNFKTRLGSSDLADWASQIEQDVDKWYELYPQIGGIFFDEGWPECGTNNVYSELYAYINAYTKRKHPGAFTVLNPGSPMAQCFENTMDTLLTFESFYDYYKNNYVPNDWTPQDARKIWHIVYNVPQDKVAEVADLARSRGAGLLEITDDTTPNPYDNVPVESYIQAAMVGVSGGSILVNDAPQYVGHYVSGVFAKVAKVDYTSVTLTWNPVQDALGYGVYKNGALVLELPPSMTRATVGMIDPGTSGIEFDVQVLSTSDITQSPATPIVSTLSLPDSGAITNVQYSQDGNTVTYTADVLVPFAFVRLFISATNPYFPRHGWPVSLATSQYNQYKIVNYLVEGNDFYSTYFRYTGAYYEGSSTPADWSWQPLINPTLATTQTTSGYTYTWNFALGDTDAVLSDWLVQGQGYAPIANVWGGCVQRFDGVGHTYGVC